MVWVALLLAAIGGIGIIVGTAPYIIRNDPDVAAHVNWIGAILVGIAALLLLFDYSATVLR